jgi:adenylate cyclase
MKSGATSRRLVPLLAPPVVLALMLAVWPLDLAQQLENVTVDWRFEAREESDPAADPRILLVGIGEYSLQKYGRWEEWTRQRHAAFLQRLSLKPPKVVAYDFFFSEPSQDAGNDLDFADWLSLFPGSVTGAVANDANPEAAPYDQATIGKTEPLRRITGDPAALIRAPSGPLPIQVIAESSWTGFVNSPPSKVDAMRRKIPLVVGFGANVYPSFVLQILMQYDGIRPDGVEVILGSAVRITDEAGTLIRSIPIDERGLMTLNYRGGKTFEPVDYAGIQEWLEDFGETGRWPDGAPPVEGQIVVVGQMAEGLTDFGPTPLRPREPLVIVQAVALNNILQGDYLAFAPAWSVLAVWLVLAWPSVWFLRRSSVTLSVAVPLILVALYGVAGFHVFRAHSLQLPLFLPMLGFLGVHGSAMVDRLVAEVRAKSRIKNLFGTYVSPEVVDRMIASGEDPKLGGQSSEITAFFSDVQSFSTFSEKLEAERLVALMIEYLSEMTDILQYQGGSLDKYIGDAIVGMFGAPLPVPDHAHRACSAAIEIQRRQAELREKWRAEGGWPEIVYQMQTRIGLNTGVAVIGNMGSRRRFNYTMMGDNVNLAARCESGAKSYGVYTMVTGETRRAAMKTKNDIAFRFLDKTVVKGRTRPVEMYEVLGFTADLPAGVGACIETYADGVAKYLARDWDGAGLAFEKAAALEPFQPGRDPGVHTNPSLVMVARCAELKADPPGEDWDGAHVMETK